MQTRAVLVGALIVLTAAGCSATSPPPSASPSTPVATHISAVAPASPSATPAPATLFYEHDVCAGADAAYDGVQTAEESADLAAIRAAGAKGEALYSTALAKLEAYPWTDTVKALFPPYYARARQQIAYYRALATAKTLTAATDLQFPEGTAAIVSPVESALRVPSSGDYCTE